MTNPYSPDETPTELFTEKTWLQGCILGAVAYGVQFALFLGCTSLLWKQTSRSSPNRKHNIFLLAYVCVMFSLGTIFMVSDAAFTQLAFITDRAYPGGPNAVENDFFTAPIDEGGNIAFVLGCWFADALLVWRCTVLYRGSRVPTWAIALGPSLVLLASIFSGVFWQIQQSATSIHATQVVNWTIVFLSLTISLNILATIAIVARIQMYRYRLSKALGGGHTSQYTTVSAMIIESAAVYSAFAIVLLVTLAVDNPVVNVFLQSMSQVQIATTLLIIYRVAQGRAWTVNTSDTVFSAHGSKSVSAGSYPMRFVSRKPSDPSLTFVVNGVSSHGGVSVTRSVDIASEVEDRSKGIPEVYSSSV